MENNVFQPGTNATTPFFSKFKIVYHLVGEQALPAYITAVQFPCEVQHFLLTTETGKTRSAAENIKRTLAAKGINSEIKYIGNEDIAVSVVPLTTALNDIFDSTNPEHLPAALDLTGGTKPMSMVGIMLSGQREYMTPVYLDTKDKKLIDFTHPQENIFLHQTLEISEFISLGGLQLTKASVSNVSGELLKYIFKNSKFFLRFQEDFANLADNKLPANGQSIGERFQQKYNFMLNKMAEYTPDISLWESLWQEFAANTTPRAQAEFLGGTWFEHYAFNLVQNSGKDIRQILLGVVLSFPENPRDAQEFDVVYTDGFSLIILECKAGRLKQEFVQKLENLRSQFTGALGKCALLTLSSLYDKNSSKNTIAERISRSRSIAAFSSKSGVNLLPARCLDFKTGLIYENPANGYRK